MNYARQPKDGAPRLYIAVHDDVPDHMVPVLVAHTMLGAHLYFTDTERPPEGCSIEAYYNYDTWLRDSFKKCVVRVNQKEFDKISAFPNTYHGWENTTMNGDNSCLIPYPVNNDELPNVLKFARLWRPDDQH